MNNRSSVLSLVMYVAVAATLVGGIGVALTAVTSLGHVGAIRRACQDTFRDTTG